ncbi:MAG: HAD family hydrolase [Polyangiaceae bacterium]
MTHPPSPAAPYTPPVYPRLSPAAQDALLRSIIERGASLAQAGRRAVVVFDLDGTLMDNRPRTVTILRELGEVWRKREHPASGALLEASPTKLAYLVRDSLGRFGIQDEVLLAEGESFWRERFFTDDYQEHDIALPGAVAFARALYAAGVNIVYFTGRDLPKMALGSFKSLRELGFPIGVIGTELVVKPFFEMPDEEYKRSEGPKLSRIGEVIAVFDNEPINCNVLLEHHPECTSIFVDTQHFPNAPPLDPRVKVIGDFRMEP